MENHSHGVKLFTIKISVYRVAYMGSLSLVSPLTGKKMSHKIPTVAGNFFQKINGGYMTPQQEPSVSYDK